MKRGRIYFVQPTTGGPIKIGFSEDVARRLRDLQAMSPVKLRVISSFAGTIFDEKRIHEELKQFRAHGEWFHDVSEVREVIDRETTPIVDDDHNPFALFGLTEEEGRTLLGLTEKVARSYLSVLDATRERAA